LRTIPAIAPANGRVATGGETLVRRTGSMQPDVQFGEFSRGVLSTLLWAKRQPKAVEEGDCGNVLVLGRCGPGVQITRNPEIVWKRFSR
jgi:hypothetical protein